MALVAVANGQFTDAGQLDQLINLLTGVMTDQPVNLKADNAHAPALLTLDTVNAGVQLGIQMKDAGVTKWEIIKLNDNHWCLYDEAAAAIVFEFASNGGGIGSIGGLSFISGLGLPGATNGAMRFVGTTPAGAPLTGTFSTGDYVYDMSTFGRWVCIAGGSPGTWVALEGAITSPPAPSVVVNTVGTTTYYYAVVAEAKNGAVFYEAIPSQSTKITNGAAIPNNTINWTQPVGCAPITDWVVLVSTDNLTWSRIQFVNNALTFTDTNQTRFSYTPKTKNPGGGFVIGGNQYQMRAYQTGAAQAINGVVSPIRFNTVSSSALGNSVIRAGYDPDGDYDPVTNYTYTVKVAGFYEVSAVVMVGQGALAGTLRLRAWIEINSNEYIEGAEVISGGANSFPASNPNDVVYLYAGDVLRVGCFFNAGAGPVLYNTNFASRFSVKYLGS